MTWHILWNLSDRIYSRPTKYPLCDSVKGIKRVLLNLNFFLFELNNPRSLCAISSSDVTMLGEFRWTTWGERGASHRQKTWHGTNNNILYNRSTGFSRFTGTLYFGKSTIAHVCFITACYIVYVTASCFLFIPYTHAHLFVFLRYASGTRNHVIRADGDICISNGERSLQNNNSNNNK